MRRAFFASALAGAALGLSGVAGAATGGGLHSAAEGDADLAHPLSFQLGPDYETGTYGTRRRVSVFSWDDGVTWSPWPTTTLGLDLPYLVQRAPAGTIGGRSNARRRPHVGGGPDLTTEGAGDALLGIEQDLVQQDDHFPLDLGANARIKLPTASVSHGLGTGEPDFTFEGNVARSSGKFYGELSAGYSIIGSPGRVSVNGVNERVNYRNAWIGSASLAYDPSERWVVGGAFHAERSPEKQFPPDEDVTFDASYRALTHVRLRMSVLRGLSRSSPDWGGSLGVSLEP